MDADLLDQALVFHGPALLRELEEEHGESLTIPLAVRRRYQSAKDQDTEEAERDELTASIQKLVARKADFLFRATRKSTSSGGRHESDTVDDAYGIMPPVESFMGIPRDISRQHFYDCLSVGDVVVGVASSVMDSGLVASLLCAECDSVQRDIDDLGITAFAPAKELPRMFAHQSVTEAYQPRDIVRGIVLSVNPETEKIILSLRDRSSDEDADRPKIGLISKDDFPVHYRRKLQRSGLNYSELLHSVLGFTNKGSVDTLQHILGLRDSSSLMRGLHRVKVPEEECAEKLRKWQASKQAHSSVVAGVEMVKKGRQLEALQHLNQALQMDPGNTEALVARGAVYANNECYLKAIEDFEAALEADPKHPNARKYLVETLLASGRRHEEQGDLEEAVSDYKEALKQNPQSADAQAALDRCQQSQLQKKKSKKRRRSQSVETISSDESDSGEHLQKTAEKLKRLIKADKKGGRRSRDGDAQSESPPRKGGKGKTRHHSSSSSSSQKSDRSSDSGRQRRKNKRRESISQTNKRKNASSSSRSSSSSREAASGHNRSRSQRCSRDVMKSPSPGFSDNRNGRRRSYIGGGGGRKGTRSPSPGFSSSRDRRRRSHSGEVLRKGTRSPSPGFSDSRDKRRRSYSRGRRRAESADRNRRSPHSRAVSRGRGNSWDRDHRSQGRKSGGYRDEQLSRSWSRSPNDRRNKGSGYDRSRQGHRNLDQPLSRSRSRSWSRSPYDHRSKGFSHDQSRQGRINFDRSLSRSRSPYDRRSKRSSRDRSRQGRRDLNRSASRSWSRSRSPYGRRSKGSTPDRSPGRSGRSFSDQNKHTTRPDSPTQRVPAVSLSGSTGNRGQFNGNVMSQDGRDRAYGERAERSGMSRENAAPKGSVDNSRHEVSSSEGMKIEVICGGRRDSGQRDGRGSYREMTDWPGEMKMHTGQAPKATLVELPRNSGPGMTGMQSQPRSPTSHQMNIGEKESQERRHGSAEDRREDRPSDGLLNIITKKGVPAISSKWDSPRRRSRWDTERDNGDHSDGHKIRSLGDPFTSSDSNHRDSSDRRDAREYGDLRDSHGRDLYRNEKSVDRAEDERNSRDRGEQLRSRGKADVEEWMRRDAGRGDEYSSNRGERLIDSRDVDHGERYANTSRREREQFSDRREMDESERHRKNKDVAKEEDVRDRGRTKDYMEIDKVYGSLQDRLESLQRKDSKKENWREDKKLPVISDPHHPSNSSGGEGQVSLAALEERLYRQVTGMAQHLSASTSSTSGSRQSSLTRQVTAGAAQDSRHKPDPVRGSVNKDRDSPSRKRSLPEDRYSPRRYDSRPDDRHGSRSKDTYKSDRSPYRRNERSRSPSERQQGRESPARMDSRESPARKKGSRESPPGRERSRESSSRIERSRESPGRTESKGSAPRSRGSRESPSRRERSRESQSWKERGRDLPRQESKVSPPGSRRSRESPLRREKSGESPSRKRRNSESPQRRKERKGSPPAKQGGLEASPRRGRSKESPFSRLTDRKSPPRPESLRDSPPRRKVHEMSPKRREEREYPVQRRESGERKPVTVSERRDRDDQETRNRDARSAREDEKRSRREENSPDEDANPHASWVDKIVSNVKVRKTQPLERIPRMASSPVTVFSDKSKSRGDESVKRETEKSHSQEKSQRMDMELPSKEMRADHRERQPSIEAAEKKRGSKRKRSVSGSSSKVQPDREGVVWVERTVDNDAVKKSSSASSSSESSPQHKKKKKKRRNSSTHRKKKASKKAKTSKRARKHSSSSSSSSSSPASSPVKKRSRTRTLSGKHTFSAPSQRVDKRTVSRDRAGEQQRRVSTGAVPPPADRKLTELEDFLKELKTKKKQQLVAEGKVKIT